MEPTINRSELMRQRGRNGEERAEPEATREAYSEPEGSRL